MGPVDLRDIASVDRLKNPVSQRPDVCFLPDSLGDIGPIVGELEPGVSAKTGDLPVDLSRILA
jgi:hypothetical protein